MSDERWSAYLDSLSAGDRWGHCRDRTPHSSHPHTVVMNEGPSPGTCPGTPDLEAWAPRPDPAFGDLRDYATEPPQPLRFDDSREWSAEDLAEMRRALRPGSQPLPTTSEREGAHDALLREHLRETLAERRLLGLARYHTLLQAGNGRDSLRDAVEEVLDLAAYLKVWTQARDEALELLAELRAALVAYEERAPDISGHAQPDVLIGKVREIEHLLGGGTSG